MELAEASIPHRLAGDMANKIGTYALALAANRHRIPFVVVAPESTRDPSAGSGRDIVIEERPASEVTGFAGVTTAPPGTAAFNPAFDVTPADLITAVVTERGVLSSESTELAHAAHRLVSLPEVGA